MSDDLDAAIIAYLTGDIADTDFTWLDEQLKKDPAAARRFAQLCEHDVVLANVLRLKAVRSSARHTKVDRLKKKYSAWWYYSAAAATVLIVASWMLYRNGTPSRAPGSTLSIATVTSVDGGATRQATNDTPKNVASGVMLHSGDNLHVADHGSLTFAYADGTLVSVEGGSDLTVTLATNKCVTLSRGAVSADVAAQQADSPMQFITTQAQADVVGTKLRVASSNGATRLDVTSGTVRLTRSSDKQSLLVKSGFFAMATANPIAPLTQRTIKSVCDDLPENAKIILHAAFADHPAGWEGEFALPPGNPDGAIAIGSHLYQPKTRFYGEIRLPHLDEGMSAGPETYLRFRYRVDGFVPGDLLKLMLKKKDGSIYHGFIRPQFNAWSIATVRLDGEFLDLENAARPLTANETLSEFVFLGATVDGQQAQQGPRLWIDELAIFSTRDNISVLNVEQ